MIFTHLCRAVAVLGLIVGTTLMVAGYRLADYIPSAQFQHGVMTFLGAIALGTLAEISYSVRKS